jgi:hypothetical protein
MKRLATIFFLAMTAFALLCPTAFAATATFSYDYLMSAEFVYEWGSGDVCKFDETDAVKFNLSAPSGDLGAGTGVGDNYPLSELSGGAFISDAYGYGDFSDYDFLAVRFKNNYASDPIWITLFMNTGLSHPDTYSQSGWSYFGGNEEKVIQWDISGIKHTDEVSNLGFQVADFSLNPANCASVTVSAVPIPAALWLFGSGLLGLAGFRKRFGQAR